MKKSTFNVGFFLDVVSDLAKRFIGDCVKLILTNDKIYSIMQLYKSLNKLYHIKIKYF